MAIELKQQLRLSQQLVMTPQLQQAIKLLQLNQIELVSLVEQELQDNPCLDEDDREEQTSDEMRDATPGETGEAGSNELDEGRGPEEGDAPPTQADSPGETEFNAEEGQSPSAEVQDGSETPLEPTNADKIADIEWDNYMDSNPQTGLEGRVGGQDDERPSLEATLSRRPTLSEHLARQIQLSAFNPTEVDIAKWIIGNIDDRGFLAASVDEVARQAGRTDEEVEAVLLRVQELDPPGVAARDLRECLLAQLALVRDVDTLVLTIVDEHLDLLQKRDFRGLVRILDATIEEVAAAAREIGTLEPRPGRAFGGDDPVYITPDIYVYKVGDEFHVLLNEDGLPKLKINNVYKDVLSKDKTREPAKTNEDKQSNRDTRNYVQDKVRSAMWLIKSIHQRQRTIYKVMQSIIRHQSEFFERGVAFLKPLNLRDVADDIEMHESTVSRVTTNKYVHTPQGIYELKYFFNSSISRFEGEAVASESVKEKIRKMISDENPRKPLSDQRIAEQLKTANIDIARRTVTKYREAMNILSSTKRRQVG
jgi:RNA polymerase sigma-54 factor